MPQKGIQGSQIEETTLDLSGVDGSTLINIDDTTKLPLIGGNLTGNLVLNDNIHVLLGTGSDLDIFHNGGNSVIKNITGELFFESAAAVTIAAFTQTAAKLYFSSSQKLETVTGGINITGALTASGGVDKLTSASGVVSVAAATAPGAGQVLTATSGTAATWQTPSAPASVYSFSVSSAGVISNGPAGWTITKGGTGTYTINHNLNLATPVAQSVFVTSDDGGGSVTTILLVSAANTQGYILSDLATHTSADRSHRVLFSPGLLG